jgi:hypothetical protein
MEVISLTTFPIAAEDSPSRLIVSLVRSAIATPSLATRSASPALRAISAIEALISSPATASVWMSSKTCVADAVAVLARVLASSADPDSRTDTRSARRPTPPRAGRRGDRPAPRPARCRSPG